MSDAALINIKNLVNRFGSQTIHDGLNLSIRKNEIIGIVGASGSGKSVLIQSILGLHKPNEGEVIFKGQDIVQMTQEEVLGFYEHWGVMFQGGALFSALSVVENVELPIVEHYDIDKELARQVAVSKLQAVGLDKQAYNKYPSELSGGMVKRVALARAMVLDPDILFLDEPTAGLDPISASAFDDLIISLKENLGLTIVIITHDIDTLVKVCDRVAVLVDKKITVDTLNGIMEHENEWIQNYFHGERMRALKEARQSS
ncbi:MAG: ABC transporter ATP-binding protein [Alphaproteobacteria bacterium]|nr:ABC transporter ATP-binding protein [Alphaproteobacteria bacterium]